MLKRITVLTSSYAILTAFFLMLALTVRGEEAKPSLLDSQSIDGTWVGTVAFTTEYMGRGLTNTGTGVGAVQSGLEFDHRSGVYIGAWGSNVKLAAPNDKANLELDYSAGYRGEITDALSYDFQATYFSYPGAKRSDGLAFDYFEYRAKMSYDLDAVAPEFSINYAPDYQYQSGSEWYLDWDVDIPIGRYFMGRLHLGREMVDNNAHVGFRDYWDYGASLGTNIAGLDVTLRYNSIDLHSGSNGLGSCGTAACSRFVLTVSKQF